MKLFPEKTRKFFGRALWWCALFAVCFLSAFYAFPYLRARGGGQENNVGADRPAVLSLWHTDTFEGGKGSRAAFLKRVAAEYGKKNRGVAVLVSSYSTEGLQAAFLKGETPDLLSFGIGAEADTAAFMPLSAEFTKTLKAGRGAGTGKAAFAVPWCVNVYALYTENGDFSDVSAENTLISSGGKNLAEAAAAIAFPGEKLSGGVTESVAAYAAFLNGEKKYLLGTGRDIYRFAARNRQVRAEFMPGYNDLYQQIGVMKARTDEKKREAAAAFIQYLLSENVQKRLTELGMFSAYYKAYGGETGGIAAQLENELFSCGGARLYADAFLSAEARKTAARCALEGNAAELKNFLKAK